jgi:hypothetical protein
MADTLATAASENATRCYRLAFHPLRRNQPHLRLDVEFRPSRADDFAGASCGQDREFQRPGRNPFPIRSLAVNSAISA